MHTVDTKSWDEFRQSHPQPWCWLCGRGEEFRDKPDWWNGPWVIERAHIVNKPRVEDRRAAVLLCSFCHRLYHGETFRIGGRKFTGKITLGNLLWLKRHFDLDYYDRIWLARFTVRKLPEARRPNVVWRDRYAGRRLPAPVR